MSAGKGSEAPVKPLFMYSSYVLIDFCGTTGGLVSREVSRNTELV